MSFPGVGTNPAFGRDPGPPPPFAAATAPPPPPDFGPPPPGTMLTVQHPYYPIPGGPGPLPLMYYYNCQLPPIHPPPPYTQVPPAPPTLPSLATALAMGPNGQLFQYISGFNNSNRFPAPAPVIDPDFPAANYINSTGGAGVESGYNYFFPTEHASVIVLKCPVPPWTLGPGTYGDIPFHAAKVPAEVTMAQLLAGFGAKNPDKAKNQFWEVYPQGGGAWGWKEHVTGDDKVMMARTVRDMGWVEKRDGVVQAVYLWISKS